MSAPRRVRGGLGAIGTRWILGGGVLGRVLRGDRGRTACPNEGDSCLLVALHRYVISQWVTLGRSYMLTKLYMSGLWTSFVYESIA